MIKTKYIHIVPQLHEQSSLDWGSSIINFQIRISLLLQKYVLEPLNQFILTPVIRTRHFTDITSIWIILKEMKKMNERGIGLVKSPHGRNMMPNQDVLWYRILHENSRKTTILNNCVSIFAAGIHAVAFRPQFLFADIVYVRLGHTCKNIMQLMYSWRPNTVHDIPYQIIFNPSSQQNKVEQNTT